MSDGPHSTAMGATDHKLRLVICNVPYGDMGAAKAAEGLPFDRKTLIVLRPKGIPPYVCETIHAWRNSTVTGDHVVVVLHPETLLPGFEPDQLKLE